MAFKYFLSGSGETNRAKTSFSPTLIFLVTYPHRLLANQAKSCTLSALKTSVLVDTELTGKVSEAILLSPNSNSFSHSPVATIT